MCAVILVLTSATIADPSRVAAQPAGSYQQSCKNTRIENDTLLSFCRDKKGRYRDTSLMQVSRCVGQISNDDGVLRCSSFGSLPEGTYQQTCRNSRVDGDTLFSSCRDVSGRFRDSSIAQVSECVGGIFNNNGALRCSKGSLPNGTYSRSCTRTRVDGESLYGECRKIGGGTRSAALNDYRRCWSDISNVDGFFSCDKGDRPAPEGTYRTTCRDINLSQNMLSAQCLDYHRSFRGSSLNITDCRLPVENRNGQLACGPKPRQTPPPPPVQSVSTVELFNCQGNKRGLSIWKASGSNQNWTKIGAVSSSYIDNICPGGADGLQVRLDPGPNLIRALDTAKCGRDDPQNFNCQVGELAIVGNPAGSVQPYVFGN